MNILKTRTRRIIFDTIMIMLILAVSSVIYFNYESQDGVVVTEETTAAAHDVADVEEVMAEDDELPATDEDNANGYPAPELAEANAGGYPAPELAEANAGGYPAPELTETNAGGYPVPELAETNANGYPAPEGEPAVLGFVSESDEDQEYVDGEQVKAVFFEDGTFVLLQHEMKNQNSRGNVTATYIFEADPWAQQAYFDYMRVCAWDGAAEFMDCLMKFQNGEVESIVAEDGLVIESSEEISSTVTVVEKTEEIECEFGPADTSAYIMISNGEQGSTSYIFTNPTWGEISIESDHPVTKYLSTIENGCTKTGFEIKNFSGPMTLIVLASDGTDLPLRHFSQPHTQEGLGDTGHSFTAP